MVDRTNGLQFSRGDGFSPLDAQAYRDRLDGMAVVSGLAVSAGSGLSVAVASGTATVGESSGSVDTVSNGLTTNVSLTSADSNDPRKDTIYIDSNGNVTAETGTARPAKPSGETQFSTYQPEPPFPSPDARAILAEVWVGAGSTDVTSSDIRDRRAPADIVGDTMTARTVATDTLNTADLQSARDNKVMRTASQGELYLDTVPQLGYLHFSSLDVGSSFDVSGEEPTPHGGAFKPDGTKFYLVGIDAKNVNEYDLSTPWDISSAAFNQSLNVSFEDTTPKGGVFKPDGTKFYLIGASNVTVYEYLLR